MNDNKLHRLADAAGLMRDWQSFNGEPRQVSDEGMRRILGALGLACGSDEECLQSLAQLEGGRLPALVTATVGQPLRLHLPPALARSPYRIDLEGGGHVDGRFGDDLSHGTALAAIDACGYHTLHTDDGDVCLAVAPPRCFGVADALAQHPQAARAWGIGVQLYSLRRDGDGGYGDYTALRELVRRAAGRGAAAVAISPVHAMFSADVHRFSPYGPSSRLFLNALHVDPAEVLGMNALHEALSEEGGDAAQQLAALERQELIDWPAAAALRLRLLRRLHDMFLRRGDRHAFDAFRAREGVALRDHACFEAIHAWRLAQGENGDWRSWPDGLRDPRAPEVAQFAREHAAEVDFHEFLQWQAARGLAAAQQAGREAGMPIGLIADLAVGADSAGSQAWSRQDEIINGLSVGAPPDQLNTRGQSWGIGAFSPHAMKARGFGAYLEMLRATFSHGGGARIDHVLGLARLWLVPHGASPEDGAYLRYPIDDLLRLIALESWRHRAIVIGEDLGTVPAGFDTRLADAGLLGIRVLQFQQDGRRFFGAREYPRSAIATTTTHDLPTMAGWWAGRDIDWRVKLDLLEPGQTEAAARDARAHERHTLWAALRNEGLVHGEPSDQPRQVLDAAAAFIAATPAPLAILPVEDALGLVEQPNLPGTIDEHPNWRRRLPQPVENLLDAPEVAARLAQLNRTRNDQGEH
ncbi:4-alpha-glucanotransferase [Noviherbaspirillum aridicola]|uniref:4-alpha-glucanotransferase n=1 Tax=Noviherbaspirillum aridicola TaxID=2849687 RepID=A0ABQ4Q7T0_9BURK|nr:4-alpha-glucanotransferase [Noviherbaspirillum aridicola]GIZ53279.1 4-alpha-glucanotransferase [Noviherbaspirillum aridicola]